MVKCTSLLLFLYLAKIDLAKPSVSPSPATTVPGSSISSSYLPSYFSSSVPDPNPNSNSNPNPNPNPNPNSTLLAQVTWPRLVLFLLLSSLALSPSFRKFAVTWSGVFSIVGWYGVRLLTKRSSEDKQRRERVKNSPSPNKPSRKRFSSSPTTAKKSQ
ncbi:hypothetical protein ScalyP_jg11795 [Parmales sp. scaly parma]|nr:hypothetical protein ScalyP_jg11795 [Parmales sp. scaly parma]